MQQLYSSMTCCPYWGSPITLVNAEKIYGRKGFGRVWMCTKYPDCDAYVGAHQNGSPKGSLANRQLREWRQAAHAAFDPLWQSGKMTRSAAYQWLSQQLEIPKSQTHIAMFAVERCQTIVKLMQRHEKSKL